MTASGPGPESDDIPDAVPDHPHVDGAVMMSFGAVIPGREELAVSAFTELSRFLGALLDDGVSSFAPYFFADGQLGDVSGFFVVEGRRDRLDRLRRQEDFGRLVLRLGVALQNVRVHTLVAGSEAGRLVNLYRQVREELGLLPPPHGDG